MDQQALIVPVPVPVPVPGARPARPGGVACFVGARKPAAALVGAALTAALLLASCGTYVGQRVESVILEALPRVVGPANHYGATVRGASADLSHFDQVSAVGVGVRRPNTPVLERIELDLLDVAVDRNARQITSIADANVTATLSASDLAAYLDQQRWITESAVRVVAPATVIVSGRFKLPGTGLSLLPSLVGEIRTTLAPRGSQLLLKVDALRLGDREAPALARNLIEQAINPLFDVEHYAVPSRIDRAAVEGNSIIVAASGSQISLLKRDHAALLPRRDL